MRAAILNYVIENASIETHHCVSFERQEPDGQTLRASPQQLSCPDDWSPVMSHESSPGVSWV
ncbi:hypothetical protein Q7C36_010929 [Tachysurus vachellii]|uniref:Uncharacterized protein n=1 Tax=Tachysurus vachellii TaxID=175792 RepID=A0AA88MX80_TACVA|nr:hypothetical protein Q7C36_010929 [Tachysurus vachellii]